ncbi:MAG TPA: hypothetical protein PLG57_08905 [Bacteroidia bacterium]|jgi:hypothetical protein|nr:hypothetical protein [Bacteroidia bacterium]HQF27664.1 hypothetical protein [Bacteroidia bacterium]HQK97621.1 hypothetical protein [Bacteroidia bacterium]
MIRCVILLLFILAGCGESNSPKTGISEPIQKVDSIVKLDSSVNSVDSSIYQDYTNYWVVIADTGLKYDRLLNQMLVLNDKVKLPIDSMGRFYNRKKDLIALPDNDEDEIYAGDYYPRRFESDYLSIEYLKYYTSASQEKMMSIVAGIFIDESSADSVLTQIRNYKSSAYKIQANLYTGCIH